MLTKVCARCKQEKELSLFSKAKRYKDGHQSYCKTCSIAYQKTWLSDPVVSDRTKKREQEWYQANKDRITPMRRKRDKDKWHYDPVYRAKKNAWKRHQYRTNHVFRKKRNAWDKIASHRRRARLKSIGGSFTLQEFEVLCARYDYRCLACGERKPLQPDHVIPIAKGGPNTIDNIQPLCGNCNYRKHVKVIDYRVYWASIVTLI